MKKVLIGLLAVGSVSAFAVGHNSRCHYINGANQIIKLGHNISLKSCVNEVKKQFASKNADGYFEYRFYTKLPQVYDTSMDVESDADGYTIIGTINDSNVEATNLAVEYQEF